MSVHKGENVIRIHKEVKLNGEWHHDGSVILRDIDEDRAVSIFIRYCLGTPLLNDEHFGGTVTALDYSFSKDRIKPDTVFMLRAHDIFRLRKLWSAYFGDFDKEIGYFMWDSGDVAGFPDEMMENREKWHFSDYRMFVWVQ